MVRHNNNSITERVNKMLNQKDGDMVETQVSPLIVPVLTIDPIISVYREKVNDYSAIYTTPTDKDFYLTYIGMNAGRSDAEDGTVYIVFKLADGTTQTFTLTFETGSGAGHVQSDRATFGGKGLLLARGQNISVTGSVNSFVARLAGYIEDGNN